MQTAENKIMNVSKQITDYNYDKDSTDFSYKNKCFLKWIAEVI